VTAVKGVVIKEGANPATAKGNKLVSCLSLKLSMIR
jgi:hypothetical protein